MRRLKSAVRDGDARLWVVADVAKPPRLDLDGVPTREIVGLPLEAEAAREAFVGLRRRARVD